MNMCCKRGITSFSSRLCMEVRLDCCTVFRILEFMVPGLEVYAGSIWDVYTARYLQFLRSNMRDLSTLDECREVSGS